MTYFELPDRTEGTMRSEHLPRGQRLLQSRCGGEKLCPVHLRGWCALVHVWWLSLLDLSSRASPLSTARTAGDMVVLGGRQLIVIDGTMSHSPYIRLCYGVWTSLQFVVMQVG